MLGTYKASTYAAVFAASGFSIGCKRICCFFTAALYSARKDNADAAEMEDIQLHEVAFFVPIVVSGSLSWFFILTLYWIGFLRRPMNVANIYKSIANEPVEGETDYR